MNLRFMTMIAAVLIGCSAIAYAQDETTLIASLAPGKSDQEKDQACQKLKLVGTARAVPALAALLTDEQLSHSARYVLETLPGPEASAALRDALTKTSGVLKAGIIDTLGVRRDADAVPALKSALDDSDAAVVSSAATALGQIGGPDATAALKAALTNAKPELRAVVANGLLLCADHLLAAADKAAAGGIYSAVLAADVPEQTRTAAFRGKVLSAGDGAVDLVVKAIEGSDRSSLLAALQLVRENNPALKGESATKAFAAAIAKLDPEIQVALIGNLAQRGDSAFAPAIVAATKSPAPAVRVAALQALAFVGDASTSVLLAESAAGANAAEQSAARQSLALLHDPKTCDALLAAMPSARPAVQAEIVRALAARHDQQAVPALAKLAQGADEPAQIMALRALATLSSAKDVGDLVKIVLAAKSDAVREAAEAALASASSRGRPADVAPLLLDAMKSAQDAPTKAALLRVAGRLPTNESLAALRAALSDSQTEIQDAALRTMADFAGLDASDDLLKLASDTQRPTAQRVLALRGYWRLVALASDRPLDQRLKMCEAGLAAATRTEEKRQGISQLSNLPSSAALKLAEKLCADDSVRDEAELACVRIASALVGEDPAGARAALQRIDKETRSQAIRADARKALSAMDQYVGYITTWAVAGPYRQEGKQCWELFGIAFAPEQPGAAVTWKRLAPPTDPSLFWQADLLPTAGGDQCVVYVKSRVFSPAARNVRLDVGSDDGNKIWINGKLVHANNVQRPIAPAQDIAQASLNEGWNDFLIKVTQNTQGCGVCVRIRNTDGSPIDGLKFDAGLEAK